MPPNGADNTNLGDRTESGISDLETFIGTKMSLEGNDGTTGLQSQFPSTADQHLPPFEIETIPGEEGNLSAILWKPEGEGSFPTVVYNHGSEEAVKESNYEAVANYYVSRGYAFLMPLRRGHSFIDGGQEVAKSEGVLFDDRLAADVAVNPANRNNDWIHEQEVDNEDVEAAARWLANQSYVDRGKMIMSGISFGGIQTSLAAEKGLGMRAFIPFAPAAMAWSTVPEVHDRLKQALQNAKAPVFLIQAENDYNLGPSQFLGPVLDELGGANRHKIYPPFQPERGHHGGHAGLALNGMDVWSQDVSDFLQEATNGDLPRLDN